MEAETDFDICVRYLSDKFFDDHPPSDYPELLHKDGSAFCYLLIDLHIDFIICVPFRSDIRHDSAYRFTGSARSKNTKSGLDFTKMVLIDDENCIDTVNPAVVDSDEYGEIYRSSKRIIRDAVKYVDTYAAQIKGVKSFNAIKFSNMYQFSTLRYFHDILGI